MRMLVLILGHFVAAIGAIGLVIEIHGHVTDDPRADIFGIVFALAGLCSGAFVAYAMHASYRLRWSGALAVIALFLAATSWGDELQRQIRGESFEVLPFLIASVLPAVLAGGLTLRALRK